MDDRGPNLAARPRAVIDRPRLHRDEVERIRRERQFPRPTQWDYLHLEGLRRELTRTFASLPVPDGPVLDLYCGTKPYLELVPWRPVWGYDIDSHFGGADIVGELPLPFADGAVGAVICTQALHMVDDPRGTVREVARVLRPRGHLILTVPHLFLAEGDFERHWSVDDVRALLAGWQIVTLRRIDGPGAAGAFVVGRLAFLGSRKLPPVRWLLPVIALALNGLGRLADLVLRPLTRRWPHSLLVVARPPAGQEPHGG